MFYTYRYAMACGEPTLRYTAQVPRGDDGKAVACGEPTLRYTFDTLPLFRRTLWPSVSRRSDTPPFIDLVGQTGCGLW